MILHTIIISQGKNVKTRLSIKYEIHANMVEHHICVERLSLGHIKIVFIVRMRQLFLKKLGNVDDCMTTEQM